MLILKSISKFSEIKKLIRPKIVSRSILKTRRVETSVDECRQV